MKFIVPLVIVLLKGAHGKEKAISCEQIVRWINSTQSVQYANAHTSAPRIRHIIHVLRTSGVVAFLVASSNGYYISKDVNEIMRYIDSVEDRARTIMRVATALKEQLGELDTKKIFFQPELNFGKTG